MKQITIIILAAFVAITASSCENSIVKSLDPPIVEYGEPHPAMIVTALELGWGSGDYQVGYINDQEKKYYTQGESSGNVGPSQFCVDGEGSIYIDDCMNFRILKYDREGTYAGQVEKNMFTKSKGTLALGMAAGPDCLYLYESDKGIIYRYRFQDKEKTAFSFSEYGVDWLVHSLNSVYDDAGNAYVTDSVVPKGPKRIYYRIDSSFSTILETREVPKEMLVDYIDGEGNFFAAYHNKQGSIQSALYKIDKEGNVATIKVLPEDLNQAISREEVSQDDIIFFAVDRYFDKEINVVELFQVPDNYRSSCIGDNGTVFFAERRYIDSNNKSPFRIYEVEVDWGTLNDQSSQAAPGS